MERKKYLAKINLVFRVFPVCGILGPRQVGKTTLSHMYIEKYFPDNARFFDLERPDDLALLENPMTALSNIKEKLIVIDEVQRRPELFEVLRVLVDQFGKSKSFLVLGSASRDLLRQSSESLAGRIGYIELPPFSLSEVNDGQKLWFRGGFPRSYLAKTEEDSLFWRTQFIRAFLEQDIPALGFSIPPEQLRRFWMMLAGYHGQIFNGDEIGKSLGVSGHTVRKYLDILAGTFMVRILKPWFENIDKRQVKSPKIYFRDSGILHALLNIKSGEELFAYHRLGSFWEGFALEEVIRALNIDRDDCYFWATHSDAELDLFAQIGTQRVGFEFKYTDSPKVTKSMYIAQRDLKLDRLIVVYPGDRTGELAPGISLYGIDTIAQGTFFGMEQAKVTRKKRIARKR